MGQLLVINTPVHLGLSSLTSEFPTRLLTRYILGHFFTRIAFTTWYRGDGRVDTIGGGNVVVSLAFILASVVLLQGGFFVVLVGGLKYGSIRFSAGGLGAVVVG